MASLPVRSFSPFRVYSDSGFTSIGYLATRLPLIPLLVPMISSTRYVFTLLNVILSIVESVTDPR